MSLSAGTVSSIFLNPSKALRRDPRWPAAAAAAKKGYYRRSSCMEPKKAPGKRKKLHEWWTGEGGIKKERGNKRKRETDNEPFLLAAKQNAVPGLS